VVLDAGQGQFEICKVFFLFYHVAIPAGFDNVHALLWSSTEVYIAMITFSEKEIHNYTASQSTDHWQR